MLFLDLLYDSGYTASIVLLRTFICAHSTCAFHRVQRRFPHVTWGMQCDKSSWWMGCAMSYNALYNPWTMGGENIVQPHHQWEINCPWVMGCTMDMGVTPDHGSWIVQQYTHHMVHGLYNNISTPWVMYCTTVYMLHDPWVVQWYVHPMVHGLYNDLDNIHTPSSMGCTTVCMFHGQWVVQWYKHSMAHGLYNGMYCQGPLPPEYALCRQRDIIGSCYMLGPLCHLVRSLQTECYSTEDTLYQNLTPEGKLYPSL